MGKLIVNLSVSLDGFIAGADDGPDLPLGRGGQDLFSWMSAGPEENRVGSRFAPPDASLPVIKEWSDRFGAMIIGRRTFDIAGGWADGHPIDAPIFVVTHEAPTEGRWSPQVTFVTDGLDHAVELARAAAGDLDVSVGAASTTQQLLRDGRLDGIELALVPLLLGSGVRLLDQFGPDPITLVQTRVVESDGVTHLSYDVVRD